MDGRRELPKRSTPLHMEEVRARDQGSTWKITLVNYGCGPEQKRRGRRESTHINESKEIEQKPTGGNKRAQLNARAAFL